MPTEDRPNTRWFRVQPIGHVRRPGEPEPNPEAFYDPFAETALEILARWEDALAGIEEYSHLLVIFWLDRARRARKPRSHVPEGREGLPAVGFFATRTPRRPNPLGVSAPQLLRREGTTLWVSGIDAWPGTPILDIKGYAPRDDLRPDATVRCGRRTIRSEVNIEKWSKRGADQSPRRIRSRSPMSSIVLWPIIPKRN